MLEIFVVLLDRLSLMVEYFLNCYSCSNAATCNMHAQFTAGENGNWFANFRTLATWISGLLATFVINLENFSVYFLHGCWCFSLKFGICGGNRNGSFQTESYYMLLPHDIYSRGVEAESIEDTVIQYSLLFSDANAGSSIKNSSIDADECLWGLHSQWDQDM